MDSRSGTGSLSGNNVPTSPESLEGRTSTDQSVPSGSEQYGDGSPMEGKGPGFPNMNFLRSFASPMQKKVTRDGQPAKRRGPKPDSKPAQTRRQELNRQAQRTHRERKEQYIKALEIEIARLREAFVSESTTVQSHFRHTEAMLRETQQENMLLREILNSRGVAFEVELQQRKNAIAMGGGPSHSARGISPSYSIAHSGSPYGTAIPPTAPPSQSGLPDFNPAGYANGNHNIMSGHSPTAPNNSSPGTTHHSHSPPEVQEVGGSHDIAIPDVPGIFEKEPQLGIDFILALEETCRDHSEYLVRRSMNSPNDPDEALFSGHALMASVPPPSHIDRTPPQKGGLQPTYPHQAPQASIHALQTLLNLSRVIKSEGYVEGGQVTPIMALQSLRGHYNYHSLTRDDVVGMIDAIRNKVRCYGFGAVMEDFELRDALATIFATKPEAYESFGNDMTNEIEDMYS